MEFKVSYTFDKKFCVYYLSHVLYRTRLVGCFILAAVSAVFAVYFSVKEGFSTNAAVLLVIAVIMVLTALAFLLRVRPMMQAVSRKHGGSAPPCTYTFGSMISVHEGTVSSTLKYSDITSGKSYGRLFVLRIKKRVVVILDKTCFTEGTFCEFLPFIRQKCKNAKI